jgi:hypothetical protein
MINFSTEIIIKKNARLSITGKYHAGIFDNTKIR